MREVGLDISRNKTKSVSDILRTGQLFSCVITVCDQASAQRCPVFPGAGQRLHWSFPDPAACVGTREERLEQILTRRLDEYKTKPTLATELIYKGGKFGADGVALNPPPPKLAAMLPADLTLEAAWTGVARVLLNLDDFLTRE